MEPIDLEIEWTGPPEQAQAFGEWIADFIRKWDVNTQPPEVVAAFQRFPWALVFPDDQDGLDCIVERLLAPPLSDQRDGSEYSMKHANGCWNVAKLLSLWKSLNETISAFPPDPKMN